MTSARIVLKGVQERGALAQYCVETNMRIDNTSIELDQIQNEPLEATSQPTNENSKTNRVESTSNENAPVAAEPAVDTAANVQNTAIPPEPVIFLSLNRSSNQTILCFAKLGNKDEVTMKALRAKYRSLSLIRWATKRVKRVNFYRVCAYKRLQVLKNVIPY